MVQFRTRELPAGTEAAGEKHVTIKQTSRGVLITSGYQAFCA
jgi:hypothetical protein